MDAPVLESAKLNGAESRKRLWKRAKSAPIVHGTRAESTTHHSPNPQVTMGYVLQAIIAPIAAFDPVA